MELLLISGIVGFFPDISNLSLFCPYLFHIKTFSHKFICRHIRIHYQVSPELLLIILVCALAFCNIMSYRTGKNWWLVCFNTCVQYDTFEIFWKIKERVINWAKFTTSLISLSVRIIWGKFFMEFPWHLGVCISFFDLLSPELPQVLSSGTVGTVVECQMDWFLFWTDILALLVWVGLAFHNLNGSQWKTWLQNQKCKTAENGTASLWRDDNFLCQW